MRSPTRLDRQALVRSGRGRAPPAAQARRGPIGSAPRRRDVGGRRTRGRCLDLVRQVSLWDDACVLPRTCSPAVRAVRPVTAEPVPGGRALGPVDHLTSVLRSSGSPRHPSVTIVRYSSGPHARA
ncbi:hypothetical protein ACFPM0_23525 [Pseudonocardia sulfidoxydans]|uniref:hypothetical protein n=1 Tax=Pseudonocardia sulfidoxydans TaxID=54011 RepID=UPI00360F810B